MDNFPAWAKIGSWCVLVDRGIDPRCYYVSELPPKSTPLKIIGFVPSKGCLIIDGHPNGSRQHPEFGWRFDRFRPLITKTQDQDIALFKSLLTPTSSEIRELIKTDLEASMDELITLWDASYNKGGV